MAYLFAFFCGGSGARVAEMYAFCAAMGLTRHDIPTHICLCDADHQNGNEATSLGTIKNYVTVRSEMYREGHTPAGAGDFFGTPISAGQWALDGRNDKNAGLAQYTLDQLGSAGDAGFVSKALFTEEERTRDIKNLGFFAHPNVGNAIVQAAILYEQDVADNEGGKVPNWYRNYIIMEADNPAIDQMFVFIQTYYNSIKELLGMSLYDGAQPINEFINTDCLIKMSSMLDHLGTVERMTGHDARNANLIISRTAQIGGFSSISCAILNQDGNFWRIAELGSIN